MCARKSAKTSESTLGEQLRYFRRKLCLRQPEMAKHLGVSMSLYSKLESNLLVSPPHTLARFASILNTSVEFLTRGTGPERVTEDDNTESKREAQQITDAMLRRIIELARREELQELAEKVANTMKCAPEHALAIIIRTVLLDDSDKR